MEHQPSKNSLQKLNHPIFLTCLTLLIFNDWILKPIYGNWLTGKLSDFVGLFAFAFFISVVTNRDKWNLAIHILTGAGFIFWKSSLSNLIIVFFNSFNIPVLRTIDLTDLMALIVLPISLVVVKQPCKFEFGRLRIAALVFVSSLAFVATTLPPPRVKEYNSINKRYAFDFSRETLISRWNAVHLQETETQSDLYRAFFEFDSVKNIFLFRNTKDTVAYSIPVSQQDTIRYNGYFVDIQIWGNEKQSGLKVLNLKTFENPRLFGWGKSKSKRKVLREFEEQVIEKIKRE